MTRVQQFGIKAVIFLAVIAVSLPAVAGDKHHERHENHGFMGVSLAQIHTAPDSGENGVYISSVQKDSGGGRAGLKSDDRIISIEGTDINDHRDVSTALKNSRPGDRVSVSVLREGSELRFDVELGDRPTSFDFDFGEFKKGRNHWIHEISDGERAILGIHATELGPQLAEFFDVKGGVLISEVTEDGPAARAGVKAGDIVTGIDGKDMDGMGSLHKALGKFKPGDEVEIEVSRRGSLDTYRVALGSAKNDKNFMINIEIGDDDDIKIHKKSRVVIEKKDN
jgi:S1-C subfamily serine protease